jgi:hypothetical protein
MLRPDKLTTRHAEHGSADRPLTGTAIGSACAFMSERAPARYRGGKVGDLLSDEEQRACAVAPPATAPSSRSIAWYLRAKATFLFEVEWTRSWPSRCSSAGASAADTVVRFLVVPPSGSS